MTLTFDLDLEKWCAPSLGGDHHHVRFGYDRSSGVGCRRVIHTDTHTHERYYFIYIDNQKIKVGYVQWINIFWVIYFVFISGELRNINFSHYAFDIS